MLARHDGVAATNNWHVGAFLRTRPDLPEPDMQFMLSRYATRPGSFALQPWHGFQLHVGVQKPASSGHVLAVSPDPMQAPEIVFNYLADPADRATAARGLKLARRIMEAVPFDDLRGDETSPGPWVASDTEISTWLTQGLDTAYHPTSKSLYRLQPRGQAMSRPRAGRRRVLRS